MSLIKHLYCNFYTLIGFGGISGYFFPLYVPYFELKNLSFYQYLVKIKSEKKSDKFYHKI